MNNNQRSSSMTGPVLLATAGVYYLFLRPQMRKWGTRLGESQRLLPGDELIPQPNLLVTQAINIDAPPEAVWPWLAQMGRERTGYYSLDLLTNEGIPSVGFIRQDIPDPAVGMPLDGGFRIIALETNRKFLFGGFSLSQSPGVTQDLTALYLLERRSDGTTRLLVRQRSFTYGLFAPVYNAVGELLSFFSIRQQLNWLKQHAENRAYIQN